MSLPDSYRACVLEKPGDGWALRSVPLEHPSQGEILVKVICCGFCLTDSSTQKGSLGPMVKWPTVPGHEFIGDVVEVGPGVTKQCNQGFFQGCKNQLINGVSRAGGFAEYCNLRSEAAVKLPKDVDPIEAASLLCAGLTVFNSIRHQNITPGETVVIQGIGGLGHLGIQYARKMGFRVIAVSTSDSKKEFAMELGAHHYINSSKSDVTEEINNLGGAKLVVLTAPNPELMGQYTACLTWLGKLLVLAPVGDITINSAHLVHSSTSVQGWHAGHAQDCEDTIEFARLHNIRCLVETFPLDKIQEAAEHLNQSKARFRVVLTME
ncbi:zinc-binding dehydrogenase [Hirsutella rhossiliensis]|uniref:Zinc-binding dehydrogenase domain-containing protein n=1 Tax=Hirsutella rhossiliensis TaxID=111463 RepID=A0A9P8MNE6_9HYPO|nr:zinc-binding dehydrogenase domain-containing protein [Hirsutella rhossiliensis]KAH0958275.1 zinc-binding dehydrogenase domain-containing protein [Hirsutella rhossiliensis]